MLSILAESLLIATRIGPIRDERRATPKDSPARTEPTRRWFRLTAEV
jgi:hypothetical protein